MKSYKIRKIVTKSGERLLFFLNSNGMPVYDVMIYSLCQLRARNISSNTIENILRAIHILYLFLDQYKYNLVELIRSEKITSMEVIESLTQFSKKQVKDIKKDLLKSSGANKPRRASPEKLRARETQDHTNLVNSGMSATRMIYIRNYVISFITKMIYQEQFGSPSRKKMIELRDSFTTAINSRIPAIGKRDTLKERLGLTQEESKEFLRVICPNAEDNPWSSEYIKVRNELLLLWIYHHGLRRGEVLSVCITDILFQEGRVIIHRSADDPNDPRIDQPLQKTRARKLALSEDLLRKTEIYIRDWRTQARPARKHSFLFTTNNGAPMSISSFTKIFKTLRTKCPQLPRSLFAHILRHTFNTRFSEFADESNMSEHDEVKARSYLMGWSETSGTAAVYNKRHIRKKANTASLKMQAEFFKGKEYDSTEK